METSLNVVEQPFELRKSKRIRKIKEVGRDEINPQLVSFYLVEGNREKFIRKIPIILQVEDDPKNFKETMSSRDFASWKDAINDEMDSIMSNHTREIVDLPLGSKPIGCKWVFRKKYHTDGILNTFKARLVTKGFRQKEGIDYFDTHAPVARITTVEYCFLWHQCMIFMFIRWMLKQHSWMVISMRKFTWKNLKDLFYWPGVKHKECKLVISLYSLEQAPKQWHKKFDSAILSDGFILNTADKCL